MRRLAGLGLAAAVLAVPAFALGATSKRRTITIGDNFYAPAKVTVKAGTTVVWKWPDDTGDSHDVKLGAAPKGVKKFHSEEASAQFMFKRTLTKPGTYKIICTLHEDMRQTITVKK